MLVALLAAAAVGIGMQGGDDGQSVSELGAATATATLTAAAVVVRPIVSVAGQVVTEYAVEVEGALPRETISYTWSGATCGTATPNRSRYAWDHREQVVGVTGGLGNRELGRSGDCNHRADPAHGNPLIAVDITGESFTARCTFQGAGSGTGPACSLSSRAGAR